MGILKGMIQKKKGGSMENLGYSEAVRKAGQMVRNGLVFDDGFQASTVLAYFYGKDKNETMNDLMEDMRRASDGDGN